MRTTEKAQLPNRLPLSKQTRHMIYLFSALIGIASWYGPELEGRPTASGEPFDPQALTAASWDFPLGTLVKVENTTTGEHVVVRINDRGPARRLGRLIDLSQASFSRIADPDLGLVQVKVTRIEHEPGVTTFPNPEATIRDP